MSVKRICRICLEVEEYDETSPYRSGFMPGNVEYLVSLMFPVNTNISKPDPLISPCQCRGSSEFVHESCLTTWRLMNINKVDKRDICTVCLSPFTTKGTVWGNFYRHLFYIATRLCALGMLLPLGSCASLVFPMLPRQGIQSTFDKAILSNTPDLAVDITGLDVSPWSHQVFDNLLSKQVINDINSIMMSHESAFRYLLKGNIMPGVIWGCSRIGAIDFYVSYFLSGTVLQSPSGLPIEFLPRSPWLSKTLSLVLNYLLFCLSLRAIRTPSTKKGLLMFIVCTLFGLHSTYNRILAYIRERLIHHLPSLALLEFGQLSSRTR